MRVDSVLLNKVLRVDFNDETSMSGRDRIKRHPDWPFLMHSSCIVFNDTSSLITSNVLLHVFVSLHRFILLVTHS